MVFLEVCLKVKETGMAFLFNRPDYNSSLGWLGTPWHHAAGSVILRRAPLGMIDARGSWPYQSVPSARLVDALRTAHAPLTLTCVISPDTQAAVIKALADNPRSVVLPLKEHLCHRATDPAAWESYSARTKRRLDLAREKLVVTQEIFAPAPEIVAEWQETLRCERRIAHPSSPDLDHFRGLRDIARTSSGVACLTLRWRKNGAACGVFLAGHDPVNGAWHAHSALANADARAAFGMYLLFDEATRVFRHSDLWLGGAPSGENGQGVYRFKQRFANFSAPAHILSIELDPRVVQRVREHTGTYPFLPNYRDPDIELRYDESVSASFPVVV